MSSKTSKHQADLEWERRVLCSDEACIGIIGPDGKCKECGMPYEGELPDHFDQPVGDEGVSVPSSTIEPVSSGETDEVDEDDAADETEVGSDNSDDEWEQRTLCSDESCIGVIGPDGLCKECGKP